MPPRKPVVYVPGVLGSTLVDREAEREIFFQPQDADNAKWRKETLGKLHGPEDPDADDGIIAGEPISSLFKADVGLLDLSLGKQADSLYDLLRQEGYEVGEDLRPVGWDWRRPVDNGATLAAIATAIGELHASASSPVVVIAQGGGGLAVRCCLEAEPQLAGQVSEVVAFGVPWAGTPQPLAELELGKAFTPLDKQATREVLTHSWAFYDLLPPDPERCDLSDSAGEIVLFEADGKPASPLTDTRWLGRGDKKMKRRVTSAAERMGGRSRTLDLPEPLRVWNMVGWGLPTILRVSFTKGKDGGLSLPPPEDDGDGVVPRRSAQWLEGPGVTHHHLPIGNFAPADHGKLWRGRAGRRLLREVLRGDPERAVNVHAAVDAGAGEGNPQWIRVRFVAQDERGQRLPESLVRLMDRPAAVEELRDDGRLTLAIHRGRWSQVRSDLRQIRAVITWKQGGFGQRRSFTLMAGVGEK